MLVDLVHQVDESHYPVSLLVVHDRHIGEQHRMIAASDLDVVAGRSRRFADCSVLEPRDTIGNSPRMDVPPGNPYRSTSVTLYLLSAAAIAAIDPALPLPIMRISVTYDFVRIELKVIGFLFGDQRFHIVLPLNGHVHHKQIQRV
mgnify:CR=1 FL=1